MFRQRIGGLRPLHQYSISKLTAYGRCKIVEKPSKLQVPGGSRTVNRIVLDSDIKRSEADAHLLSFRVGNEPGKVKASVTCASNEMNAGKAPARSRAPKSKPSLIARKGETSRLCSLSHE